MMLFNPKNYANVQREISDHYELIDAGIDIMYSKAKVSPVVDEYSLGLINKIIKEDKDGDGFNTAFRTANSLTLPLSVVDHLHASTQATEHTQWNVYQKVPVGFTTLKLDEYLKKLGE